VVAAVVGEQVAGATSVTEEQVANTGDLDVSKRVVGGEGAVVEGRAPRRGGLVERVEHERRARGEETGTMWEGWELDTAWGYGSRTRLYLKAQFEDEFASGPLHVSP
jgi:hypothetical protein